MSRQSSSILGPEHLPSTKRNGPFFAMLFFPGNQADSPQLFGFLRLSNWIKIRSSGACPIAVFPDNQQLGTTHLAPFCSSHLPTFQALLLCLSVGRQMF